MAVVRGSPGQWLGWYDARGCFPLLSEAVVVSFKANAERRHHIPKQRHRATNFVAYDVALRQRGRSFGIGSNGDFVAGVARPLQSGHLVSLLRETDVLRTPKFQHPV